MPKIIPELKNRFIEAAKRRLLESNDVTIRQVAQDCDTAVGTVYNYFPSKEALLAEVMTEDWRLCCEHMHQHAAMAEGPLEALRATTMALRGFTAKYAALWRSYANARDSMEALNGRHRMIVAEIAAAAAETIERFDVRGDAYLAEVLAELILYASRTEDGFDRIAGVLEKILA